MLLFKPPFILATIEVVQVAVVVAVMVELEVIGVVDFLLLLFFLPPPTGTLRSVPPLVQCLLQALQK
jgi:hypothetical protein